MSLAWIQKLAAACLLLTAAAGCLVTDRITFPIEEDISPTITSRMTPVVGPIWIDKTQFPMGWTMEVLIRDLNVSQPLEARFRLVQAGQPFPPFSELPVPVQGDPKRDFSFTVPTDKLLPRTCDRLDLAVSGSFPDNTSPTQFDFTKVDFDLAEASWMIWEGLGDVETSKLDKQNIANTCPDTVQLKPNPVVGPTTGQ